MNIEEMSSRIIQLEVDSRVTKAELLDVLRQMNAQKIEVIDAINLEFAQIHNRIDTTIYDTHREVNDLNAGQVTNYNAWFYRTKAAVDNLEDGMRALESRSLGEPREDEVEEAESTKGKGTYPSSRPSRSS